MEQPAPQEPRGAAQVQAEVAPVPGERLPPPVAKAGAAPEVAGRQPWEMTKEEFVNRVKEGEENLNKSFYDTRSQEELKRIGQIVVSDDAALYQQAFNDYVSSGYKGKLPKQRHDIYTPENEHRAYVKYALSTGELTPAEYNRLHASTYGPLETFAPEVARIEAPFKWGKEGTNYLRKLPGQAAWTRFLAEAKEVGKFKIEGQYHPVTGYHHKGKLVVVGESGRYSNDRPVHQIDPNDPAFSWLQRKDVVPIAEKFGAKVSQERPVFISDEELGGTEGYKKPQAPRTIIEQPEVAQAEAAKAGPDPFAEPTELGAGFNPFFSKRIQDAITKQLAVAIPGGKEFTKLTKLAADAKAHGELIATTYAPEPGIPLQGAVAQFLQDGNPRTYIDNLPSKIMQDWEGSGISARDVWRYGGAEAREGIASHKDRLGYTSEVTKGGGVVHQDFVNAVDLVPDIPVGADFWVSPPNWIRSVEGTQFGKVRKDLLNTVHGAEMGKYAFQHDNNAMLEALAEELNISLGDKNDIILGEMTELIDTADVNQPLSVLAAKPGMGELLKKIPQEQWRPMLTGAIRLRQFFNDQYDLTNRAREVLGIPPIPYREGYFPSIKETLAWWKMGKTENTAGSGGVVYPDYIKPGRVPNPREKKRLDRITKEMKGGLRLGKMYGDQTAKELFDNPTIQFLRAHERALRNRPGEKAKPNLADALGRWADMFAGREARIDKIFTEMGKIGEIVKKIVNIAGTGIKVGAMPLNVLFTFGKQWTSIANVVARTDVPSSLLALRRVGNKDFLRSMGPLYGQVIKNQESRGITAGGTGGGPRLPSRLKEPGPLAAWNRMAGWMIQGMEQLTVYYSGAAADVHGRKKGLTGRNLQDHKTDVILETQSDYHREGLQGILRNRIISGLLPFQTFAMDVLSLLRQANIPGLRRILGKTGAYKEFTPTNWARLKMLSRWYGAIVATSIIYDQLTDRPAWSPWAFVPILGPMLGGGAKTPTRAKTSVGQMVWDLQKGIKNFVKYGPTAEGTRDLRRFAFRWALGQKVGGGIQLNRVYEAIEAIAFNDGYVYEVGEGTRKSREMYRIETPSDIARAFIGGPGSTGVATEYWNKRDKKKKKTHSRGNGD